MPSFETLLARPGIGSVLLVELTAAVPLAAWIYTGANSIYKHALPSGVTLASFAADEAAVTEAANLAVLDSTAGRWFQSGAFIYWRAASGSVFDFDAIGTAEFFFSDTPKAFTNFYDPRLKSVPKLSLRIEERFGSVTQVGGGKIAFENADAFFDSLAGKVRWDNGTAVLKIGLDTSENRMAYGDYRTVGTWSLDGGDLDDSAFTISVKERKQNLKLKIPSAKFSRDDYPYLTDSLVGKTIPTIYGRVFGVAGFLVNPNTYTVKVCGHAIKGFIGLRRKENRTRTEAQTLDWFAVAGTNYYRTAFTGDLLALTCNSATMTKLDKVEDVDATDSSFTTRDNFIYLRPPAGINPTASNTSLDVKISFTQFTEIDFATRDEANGEFTIAAEDWDQQAELAVDVIGKAAAGVALENPADIVEDILATVGETDLNAASFTAASAWFDLGTDNRGATLLACMPSLYLKDERDALTAIKSLLTVTGAFLFVNADGEWFFQVAAPSPVAADLTELELFEVKRDEDSSDVPTSVKVNYAKREIEKFSQTLTVESDTLRRRRGLTVHTARTVEADLWREADAEYLAHRILNSEGSPLVIFQVHLPRLAMVLAPGDCVRVRRDRATTDEFLEVLGMEFDISGKAVTLTLGDVRGWGRSCGFWMADGTAAWDDGMTDEEALTAAQAGGYWTDDNSFADSADARSYHVSRYL